MFSGRIIPGSSHHHAHRRTLFYLYRSPLLYFLCFFSSARLARDASLLLGVGVRAWGGNKSDGMDRQKIRSDFLASCTAHKWMVGVLKKYIVLHTLRSLNYGAAKLLREKR